jgi:putrescine aminotransferase
MVGDRVAAALLDEDREFHHGFTYSGHPAACAVACAAINILRDEKVVEHVRDVAAPYLAQRWAELADHPLVGETRTLGLLGAIELVRDKSKRRFFKDPGKVGTLCRDICFDNGLVMRAVRDTMIVSPPLVISRAQIDELADKARRCLDLAWAAVQKGDY